jgi:hypothetical protein
MTIEVKCKIWPDGHMLFGDVFLNPQQIKHLVNWLNLHIGEINEKKCVFIIENKESGMSLSSVFGGLMVSTHRDFGSFNSEQLSQIKQFINDNREMVGCQEVTL